MCVSGKSACACVGGNFSDVIFYVHDVAQCWSHGEDESSLESILGGKKIYNQGLENRHAEKFWNAWLEMFVGISAEGETLQRVIKFWNIVWNFRFEGKFLGVNDNEFKKNEKKKKPAWNIFKFRIRTFILIKFYFFQFIIFFNKVILLNKFWNWNFRTFWSSLVQFPPSIIFSIILLHPIKSVNQFYCLLYFLSFLAGTKHSK